MKIKVFYLFVFLVSTGCASTPDNNLNYQEIEKFHRLKYDFSVNEVKKKIFTNKNTWPSLYASFNNVNYYYGEKLRMIKSFSKDLSLALGSTNYALVKELEFKLNFFVIGENGYTSNSNINFKVDYFCGDKKCTPEIIDRTTALETFNNFKKAISKVHVSINSGYDTPYLLLNDPLKEYRSDRLLSLLTSRRHIWHGMPKSLFDKFQVSKSAGSFICGPISTCQLGYTNIEFRENKVFKYEKNLSNRHIFRR